MKLLIVSSLLSLALGSNDVVTATRGLAVDPYFVGTDNLAVTLPNPTTFAFTAQHNGGESAPGVPNAAAWADDASGLRWMYVFKNCPHGAGPAEALAADANFLGKIETGVATEDAKVPGTVNGWIDSSAMTTAGSGEYGHTTTLDLKILPSVSLDTSVWVADTPDPSTATTGGTATFCVWFGLGPADEVVYDGGVEGATASSAYTSYGFREIILTAKFTFNGEFSCINFQTQAFDPVTGEKEIEQSYGAKATMCPSMPAFINPGRKACIEICVDPATVTATTKKDVYIDGIHNLDFCEISNPDTSAPNYTPLLRIVDKIFNYPGLEVVCDDSNDKLGSVKEDAIKWGCCQASFYLPAEYFPQVGGEGDAVFNPSDPDQSSFSLCGQVVISPNEFRKGNAVTDSEEDLIWAPERDCTTPSKCPNPVKKCKNLEGACLANKTKRTCRKRVNKLGMKVGGFRCREALARRLTASEESRMLQEESDEELEDDITAALDGSLDMYLVPAEESSSKKTIVAGAAAIGALGAALLI